MIKNYICKKIIFTFVKIINWKIKIFERCLLKFYGIFHLKEKKYGIDKR